MIETSSRSGGGSKDPSIYFLPYKVDGKLEDEIDHRACFRIQTLSSAPPVE
ncbi:hypothetical protein DY000_02059301 [Brassica cretica]|uniref:Uncharacterized protein n=1 Tax=Brassica cretica TaxID=69181 RepID=A0ABQ7AY50_BRACR|nr:hypothetical protein DY000_02059301 [Brassica cretica]